MNGIELKEYREDIGLSQAKLSVITGIRQYKISAFELCKQQLEERELNIIRTSLTKLNTEKIKQLKKKRYQNHEKNGKLIASRKRRNYKKSSRNEEYLKALVELEAKFQTSNNSKLKATSFFAGCGGLCYGVKAAGFKIVATNELVEEYKKIYLQNFPETNFLPNEIRDIKKGDIQEILLKNPTIDLMVGGPPCQGFSLAGKRDIRDERNTLFNYYLNISTIMKPKVILMENVRLLTSMRDPNGTLVSERILQTFEKIGYKSKFFLVNAKNYGVPQHRDRVIFIGIRKDLIKQPTIPFIRANPNSDLFNTSKPYFNFSDAVSDLEFLETGEKSQEDEHHWAVSHPEHVLKWLIDVPQGASAHENEDENLRPPSGYNTTYKRQIWDEPGSTVATTYGMISGCRNVHPIATRALTTREALRLQSFPDSFKLNGTAGVIRTVIGNAVPPLLAYELAEHIKKTYIL